MTQDSKLILKAMCLFTHHGKMLVSRSFDKVKKTHYYRLLGGGIEFFEPSEQAIRREIREELHSEIERLRLIEVIENCFTYEGSRWHEVDFLYAGDLARKELYTQERIPVVEKTYRFEAEWLPIKTLLAGPVPVFPPFDYARFLQA